MRRLTLSLISIMLFSSGSALASDGQGHVPEKRTGPGTWKGTDPGGFRGWANQSYKHKKKDKKSPPPAGSKPPAKEKKAPAAPDKKGKPDKKPEAKAKPAPKPKPNKKQN